MRDINHFIDGASFTGASGRFADVFNPNTGEVQARVQLASVEEMDLAVQAAQAAVDTARLNLDFTTVRAPIGGHTGVRLLDAGNLVTASQNTIRQNHANRAKTHCPKGHPLSGDNLLSWSDGRRRCRACMGR